ncbi:MAG: reverse transcriptase family protein [Terriglobales bacterium]
MLAGQCRESLGSQGRLRRHYLCGGVKGRTVIDNVSMHIGTPVLVTLDIRNFFPTITPTAVYRVWSEILGCSPSVSSVLTRLTTFKRHLPQGSATSTLLANLVLYSVDAPIREACRANGVQYSTWVDDIALSGKRAPEIIQTAVDALRKAGFSVPHRKLKVMGTGGRMILNKVLLGRFPGVVRERVAQLRSGIHKLRTGAVPGCELGRYCLSLQGAIHHLSSIVPRRAQHLQAEYDEVCESVFATARRFAAASRYLSTVLISWLPAMCLLTCAHFQSSTSEMPECRLTLACVHMGPRR